MKSKSAFLRRQILYGFVYDIDYSELREYNAALGRIGNNLNQIAKRMNATGNIYAADVKQVKVVLVYKCGQKKLNNLYYQVKEQRRRSTWRKTKNLTLRNLNNRLWICIMPEEPRIHNWNVNMA